MIRTTLLGEGNITLRGCCLSGGFDGLCGRKKINGMKKVLSVLAVSILFFATGCKKEGCTNQDATNYSSEADDDDGSCSFEGEVVFWYGESVANGLVAIGSTTLKSIDAIYFHHYINLSQKCTSCCYAIQLTGFKVPLTFGIYRRSIT